ncbi:hypothetical protein [Tenacibaculum amylolyticum]|uniref:hypothetical protein n=1 Tax=Tenacibaculum amylolyticum TaxID=104269 RepID=UPI003896600F
MMKKDKDRLIKRHKIFKKLIKKGYTNNLEEDSFKKSVKDLNKEKLENENKRLENKLVQNVRELINS